MAQEYVIQNQESEIQFINSSGREVIYESYWDGYWKRPL